MVSNPEKLLINKDSALNVMSVNNTLQKKVQIPNIPKI